MGMAAVCVGGVIGSYLLFVRTRHGQEVEYYALLGASTRQSRRGQWAWSWLEHITVHSLGVGILAVLAVGLLRRRVDLVLAGAATICVTLLVARVLKNWVLTRPALVNDPDNVNNSFPSGHVTTAMAASLGLLMVVPYAWRGITAVVSSVCVVSVVEMTMTAKWHRMSDTIAGNLIALAVACLVFAVLARRNGICGVIPRRPVVYAVLVVLPLLGYALWTLRNGLLPTVALLSESLDDLAPQDLGRYFFQAQRAVATTTAALTVLAFLAVLRRVEPAPSAPRQPFALPDPADPTNRVTTG